MSGSPAVANPRTWIADCEWAFRGGRIGYESSFEPVVFCVRRYGSRQRYSFWGRDHGLDNFINDHINDLFVSHFNVAEMKYLLRREIELPQRWFDTYVASRVLTNRPSYPEAGLLSVLGTLGLPHRPPAQKDDMREWILRLQFDPQSTTDRKSIIKYCHRDCEDCGRVYGAICPRIDPVAMTIWCRYLAAAARMELRGVSTDAAMAHKIWLAGADVNDFLREKVNSVYPIYVGTTLSKKRFFAWAASEGIKWPARRNEKGTLFRSMDDATLKSMSVFHPFIGLVRQVKKTTGSLGRRRIIFDGRTGRHHYDTSPFRSITGRNQPKDFIFGGPKWMRNLIVSESALHTLCYVDFEAQESGVAACLSGDPAMCQMYMSSDPHLFFAKLAGAVPPDGRREDYEFVRDFYKTVSLGALYWMTAEGISERLGISLDEAETLLGQHKALFPAYWTWSRRTVQAAFDTGRIRTSLGWESAVPSDSKFRTWANWPIQAASADIMRLFII
jgi:DNA polymerase I